MALADTVPRDDSYLAYRPRIVWNGLAALGALGGCHLGGVLRGLEPMALAAYRRQRRMHQLDRGRVAGVPLGK